MVSCPPSHCTCGTTFSVDQVLSCLKGGFPSICHNEVRDLTAEPSTEMCHDVEVEPHLQPYALNDETFDNVQDAAYLDISMSIVFGRLI